MCQGGGTWVAWGEAAGTVERVDVPVEDPKYSIKLIQLTDQEVRNYYQGFSNRVLWPLSHYFLDRCHFRTEYWKAYESVNHKFARAYSSGARSQDSIWIHDFHLTLLPGLIRGENRGLSIGFFLAHSVSLPSGISGTAMAKGGPAWPFRKRFDWLSTSHPCRKFPSVRRGCTTCSRGSRKASHRIRRPNHQSWSLPSGN